MQYVENLEKAHFVKLKFCPPAHYVDAYLEMQGKKRSKKYKLLEVDRTFIVPVAFCDN